MRASSNRTGPRSAFFHAGVVVAQAYRATIHERIQWADELITLVLAHHLAGFRPGQFVRIGTIDQDPFAGKPYSIASAPGAPLEILLNRVAGGELTPALFRLRAGDEVLVGHAIAGNFTLDSVPPARTLWMIATGTGLAPYLSMLRSGEVWKRFARAILVHGVRRSNLLSYQQELEELEAARGRDAFAYVPRISGDPRSGRVTDALRDGRLEKDAGEVIAPDVSQVLLCGNPVMITEMRAMLEPRGLRKNKRRDPGHITTESFW